MRDINYTPKLTRVLPQATVKKHACQTHENIFTILAQYYRDYSILSDFMEQNSDLLVDSNGIPNIYELPEYLRIIDA